MVLYCHITTRIPDEPYDSLLSALGGSFFPTLFFLDANGEKIGEHDVYAPRTVEAFRESLAAVKRAQELRAKEELGKAEQVELFLLDARLGMMDYPDARDRAKAFGEIDPDAAAKVNEILVNGEVEYLMQPPPRSAQDRIDLGADFAEMAAAGKVPTKAGLARSFWIYQLVWADAEKNADAYAKALEGVKKALGDDARYAKVIERYENRLAELRAAAEKGGEKTEAPEESKD